MKYSEIYLKAAEFIDERPANLPAIFMLGSPDAVRFIDWLYWTDQTKNNIATLFKMSAKKRKEVRTLLYCLAAAIAESEGK